MFQHCAFHFFLLHRDLKSPWLLSAAINFLSVYVSSFHVKTIQKFILNQGKQINGHLQSVSNSAGTFLKRRDLALSIAGRLIDEHYFSAGSCSDIYAIEHKNLNFNEHVYQFSITGHIDVTQKLIHVRPPHVGEILYLVCNV